MNNTPEEIRQEQSVSAHGTDTEEKELPPVQVLKKRFYALLIGIDKYPNLDSLKGAITDVNTVEKFLTFDLGIPSAHIVTLRNEEATRSRILQEFQALWQNKDIQRNDPILIYYAGHGGLTTANEGWKDKYGAQKIQVIFPYDYEKEDPSPKDPECPKVNSIPDRTIATLLNELSAKKGDNITVIFDSCHSASGTRADGENSNRRYRNAEVKFDIQWDIDDELFKFYGIDPSRVKRPRDAQLLLNTDQTSHIHLAACGVDEKALEEDGQGMFTTELLKKIRENQVDKITYQDLLRCLDPISNQSPQCYGAHKDRFLFDARISPTTFIPVRFVEPEWILEAGEASGVTKHSVWELHVAPVETSQSAGRFKVVELYAADAILEAPPSVDIKSKRLYARCVEGGTSDDQVLNVWISPTNWESLFEGRLEKEYPKTGARYKIVHIPESADIKLEVRLPDSKRSEPAVGAVTKAEVVFYLCDNLARQYEVEMLPRRKVARKEEVEVVLAAAAKWLWHLRRGNTQSKVTGQTLSMNMVKIANSSRAGRPIDRLPNPASVPVTSLVRSVSDQTKPSPWSIRTIFKTIANIFKWSSTTVRRSTVVEGVVEITADSALYGFDVTCDSRLPVYVRMFYFDATDFSISDMFGHNVGNGVVAPDIPRGGTLSIGNGIDGGSPIKFSITSGQSVELGFMKVFWSTKPLEVDDMKQKSGFDLKPGTFSRMAEQVDDPAAANWGVACLALVLKEPGKHN